MIVQDELNQNVNMHMAETELLEILHFIRTKKEQEIDKIKSKINKYVQKKNAEETFYQSLSPMRKLFTGRSPSHHQAVEYIAHVKEPLQQIERLKQGLFELNHSIRSLQEEHKEEITLSTSIFREVRNNHRMENFLS
ncbi:hypothetical protein QUF79_14745 [Fictibacillus enclensis]|uniref:hypothetical protein n=1 Tax=Fictibacillus enclensis TaxID=1017270 RepID=UPI0025A0F421|nr:hypothetical protein [Fictibacillus enclensis]MDM5199276.1 hypothetical protein [Fictibacillus enclensis]